MFVTEITYIGDPETVAKEFLPIVSEVGVAVAEQWHQKTLPDHFLPRAMDRYGYAKRTARYQTYKVRKTGQGNPMVFSGDMKRELERTVRITSLKSRLDVRLRMTARAVNLWPAGGGRKHDFPKDLTATTDDERQAMAQAIQEGATKEIQRRKWPAKTITP